jgi:hypothetical protein
MTRHIEIQIRTAPDSYDLSAWRDVVAVTSNGAYWPVAVAFPGRAGIIRRALQAYAEADPEGLVDEIYEAMGDQQ